MLFSMSATTKVICDLGLRMNCSLDASSSAGGSSHSSLLSWWAYWEGWLLLFSFERLCSESSMMSIHRGSSEILYLRSRLYFF